MDYYPHKNDQRVQLLIWLTKAPVLFVIYLKQKLKQNREKKQVIKNDSI